jgi:GT2 family glycosyltransferase
MPRVSVCLPNLNTRFYLPERLQTIFAQTFTDWELVVVDNHSDDGAWEYFGSEAAREPRMRISQAPREGMYANWNNTIRLACGEYIYIATSDDTMAPDCLEHMVRALDKNPDCAIAHCCLETLDGAGALIPNAWENAFITQFFGAWMDRAHIRLAPHDGLLYCAERCVYTSITQLLIRRSLFDKIGLFRTDLGSEGDWEWEMRASLLANTLHVPQFLATWRIHPEQATKRDRAASAAWHAAVDHMIRLAVDAACRIQPDLTRVLDMRKMTSFARRNQIRAALKETDWLEKIPTAGRWLLANPDIAADVLLGKLCASTRPVEDDFAWAGRLIGEITEGRPLLHEIPQ